MKEFISILLGVTVCMLMACDQKKAKDKDQSDSVLTSTQTRGMKENTALVAEEFAYELENPDWELNLPTTLIEVSGLGYTENHEIVMVQDEQGIIFVFDLETKEITSKHKFKKAGDFEGIEVLGETAYVLRSDGDIYEVINYRSETLVKNDYETALSTANDTEGLGYDPMTGLLLISSKESDRLMGVKYKDKQVIVSFDPTTKSLRPNPFLVLDLDDIKDFLKKNAHTEKEEKFAKKFDPDKSSSFKPSAISVHPLTNEIYLLASNGNLLVVLDRQFRITQAKRLKSKNFPQPEGMCFDAEGNLYISNEGVNGPGNLKKFSYRKS